MQSSVALDGYTAFAALGTGLQVVNTENGQITGSAGPAGTVAAASGSLFSGIAGAAPFIADINGQSVALAGYVIDTPGQGTTPDTLGVAWDIVAPLPGQAGQNPQLNGTPTVRVVGMSGSTAVATFGDDVDGYGTVAFDVANRRSLWQSQSFLASAVVGSAAIGTVDPGTPSVLGAYYTAGAPVNLAGLSVTRGTTEWQKSQTVNVVSVQQAGPGTVMVEAADPSSGGDTISLLRAASGAALVISDQQGTLPSGATWACHYDEQSAVACDDPDSATPTEFAVDGTTGQVLWQLPDTTANRTGIAITAVYDGAVYGTTPNGSPIVISAQTGKDVNDSPGVAPLIVDSYVALAGSPNEDGFQAYPASS